MLRTNLGRDFANPITFAAIIVFLILVTAFFVSLFDAKPGEIASALGAIIGGIIGAAGAAVAVYLTLSGQREDESEKTSRAVLSEIAELVKFPIGQLGACGKIQTGEMKIPKAVLPQLLHTPEPIIYRSVADRISRLPRPTLVVSFYNRLSETRGLVALIVNAPPTGQFTTPSDINGLADLLISQCQLARMILSSTEPDTVQESKLATEMRNTMIGNIDEQLEIAKHLFPQAESFLPKNDAGTPGSAGLKKI